MDNEVCYKNSPTIESSKRLHMAYLLLTNPELLYLIKETKSNFFHGTNANALPSILKYGLNCLDTSVKNNIPVTTGEKWSRFRGQRDFISLTDCLDVSMIYASSIEQPDNESINPLLNFGVILGTSLIDTSNLQIVSIRSDFPEIGVVDNLPLDYIKFIAVQENKVEFVKKMIGQRPIEVISINLKDPFFHSSFFDMIKILNHNLEKESIASSSYPVFSKQEVKPIVNERRFSKIHGILQQLKSSILRATDTYLDKGEER